MATLADLESELATAVLALPGGTKTRLASDYSETARVAIGQVGVQIRLTLVNRVFPDSAVSADAARVEIVMVRRLGVAESERAYALGAMATDQAALIDPDFWTALAAIYQFGGDGEPTVNLEPERRGPVFIYSLIADVVLSTA